MKLLLVSISFFFMGSLSHAEPIVKKTCFSVEGMTCSTCDVTLRAGVRKLDGIIEVSASYKTKNAVVSYDSKLIRDKEIKEAIDNIGYKATEIKCSSARRKEG